MRRPILSVGRRVRFRHILGVLEEEPRAPRSVLDAGCGDGRLSALIARRHRGWEVVGVDVNEAQIAAASAALKNSANLRLHVARVGGLRLERRFDAVVCGDVLEHVADDAMAVRWLSSHLLPHGRLILHVPASPQEHPLRSVEEAMRAEVASGEGPHLREGYRPDVLCRLVRQAGFSEISIRFTFHKRLTRLAADIDTWTYLRKARPLKAMLLLGLLIAAAFERRPSSSETGNGLLLVARRLESAAP